ncbi:MAG: MOSC domain-containing protein [Alphaproteobacteria bacterium]|nr:MOSC domain-containing protein [Alphaproteobacteria bacterium]
MKAHRQVMSEVGARHSQLAGFSAGWDDDRGRLTIRRGGWQMAIGRPAVAGERMAIEDALVTAMAAPAASPIRLVGVPGVSLSDYPAALVSIVSLSSLRDLEAITGTPCDGRRFRANLYVDGWEPWAEVGWSDRTLALGTLVLRLVGPIERCAATTVNPDTGSRDVDVLAAMQRRTGRIDCGMFAEVVEGRSLSLGYEVQAAP